MPSYSLPANTYLDHMCHVHISGAKAIPWQSSLYASLRPDWSPAHLAVQEAGVLTVHCAQQLTLLLPEQLQNTTLGRHD